MPPKKKTKVDSEDADEEPAVAVHQLEDIMADILGWLCVEEITCSRRICKKWKEAVKKTIVPPSDFVVNSVEDYNAMNVMAEAMPNLQQIRIGHLGWRDKWSDGEDLTDERLAAETANYTTHDIEIISNFSKLRILDINGGLNGRYPVLFNFPMLQKLTITYCYFLKFDLEMLAGLPSLKELVCYSDPRLTGNISSLKVLKDTLEKVHIGCCSYIEGNFMDLADFPHLRELNLLGTPITGDIPDIGENDFSSLEQLKLPKTVYGGRGYEFQRISDGPDLVRTLYLLKKQHPALKMEGWFAKLSEDSPDWYEPVDDFDYPPPFYIRIVQAGSRVGYRWTTICNDDPCEVNWLDPQPDRESSYYEGYIVQLEKIQNKIDTYRGFHQPPTEEEYHRLVEG